MINPCPGTTGTYLQEYVSVIWGTVTCDVCGLPMLPMVNGELPPHERRIKNDL